MRCLQVNRQHFAAHEVALETCGTAPGNAKFMAHKTSGAIGADEVLGPDVKRNGFSRIDLLNAGLNRMAGCN